ncbi:MAG: hypothetical protein LBQ20_11575 [Rhodanobacter sp.]|jgi:hypothetical protein|nr:hypothetical protein [Rhodanobacter sp.]
MADQDAINSFKEARAPHRETAKWMVSVSAGAATLFVGSSAVSQLGTFDLCNHRLWIAFVALLISSTLCGFLLKLAVDVLLPVTLNVQQMVDAVNAQQTIGAVEKKGKGDYEKANQILENQFKNSRLLKNDQTVLKFFVRYLACETPSADEKSNFQLFREAALTALVQVRFNRMMARTLQLGGFIIVAFVVFAWAANPPKDTFKMLGKPYSEPLTPELVSELKAANVAPVCLAADAQLIVVGGDARSQTAILLPPKSDTQECQPRVVTLPNGIVQIKQAR